MNFKDGERLSLELLLPHGTLVGGRFRTVELLSSDHIGILLNARDEKTKLPTILRLIRPDLITQKVEEKLREEIRIAASLSHPSIAMTYGMGTAPNGAPFVATESIEGAPLSERLLIKKSSGELISLHGVYNMIAHICKALAAVQAQTCHGTLRPSVVWITQTGRVKIADFGLSKTLVEAHSSMVLGPIEQAYLAPEVKGGHVPNNRCDIFGIGAIIYQSLTGRSASEGFVAPSQIHQDVTPELDQMLLRCLATQPKGRFDSVDEIRSALVHLIGGLPRISRIDDFGIEPEVDIELLSLLPPRMSQPNELINIGAILSKLTENDKPRWVITKNAMDHGPFLSREVIEQIAKGEARKEDILFDMSTGKRCVLHQSNEFHLLLESYEQEEIERARKQSLVQATEIEKSTTRKQIMIVALFFILAVFGAVFFILTRQHTADQPITEREVDELFDIGRIQASASGDILPDAPMRSNPSRPHAENNSQTSQQNDSYEEAMNQAVDIGDVSQPSMISTLTGPEVTSVINRHIGRIYGACVPSEKARGSALGRVQIDMAIAGNGRVLGASVRQGSPQFHSCIAHQVATISFPRFNAPRMGARYTFSTD